MLKPIPLFPSRQVLFILASLAVALFAFAFAWYIQYTVIADFASAGHTVIASLDTNSTTSDSMEVFFGYASEYVGVLALIGFAIWTLQYSQKKGSPVYE